eukprot:7388887-Prymnesium_polylepis.1
MPYMATQVTEVWLGEAGHVGAGPVLSSSGVEHAVHPPATEPNPAERKGVHHVVSVLCDLMHVW